MTGVWATPVPLYLQGRGGSQAPAADVHSETGDPLAGTQRLGASQQANDVLAQNGARAPMRRHSLGSVPTAQKVSEANEKWLDYAPTSPQRRKSFVSEPSAVSGNPFEIYKEPDTNNDSLTPNTFYEAGSSYTVNEKPLVMSDEPDWTMQPTVQSVTPATAAPPAQPKPTPALVPSSARPSSLGLSSSSATPPRGTPTPKPSNPFLDYIGVPLSPVRYSKPAPKVVLTPRSSAQVVQAFAELDPFKRIDSPSSSVPLDQLQKDNPFVQQHQSQQPSGYSQQQQQYSAGWGQQQQFGFPQQQPRAAPAFGTTGFGGDVSTSGFSANGSTTSFGFDAFPGTSATTSAFGLPPWSPKKSTLNGTNAFALGFDSPPEAAPTLSTFGSESPGSREAFENSAEMFDPVRQKSLAKSSFDLDAAGFFGNSSATQEQQQPPKEYVEDDEDEEEPPADDEGTEDESVGDGTAQFEVQEDQFSDDIDSSRCGAKYEVTFTAPTQFGMLLERKDEWTRGEVRRRERTVVTLVVDGGEAETKNVTVGSLIVSINGVDVTDKTYKETLELVKAPQRPMKVVFERENPQDEIVQGYFFVSKGPFFSVPTSMDKWRRKYVVLGGPIAKKNVLQIYDSKKAYHNTVVALFQKKGLSHRVKTYALTYSFKTTDLQERKMEGNSAPLKIFTFMTPTAKFKSIRIASESRKSVQVLFDRMMRFTGKK